MSFAKLYLTFKGLKSGTVRIRTRTIFWEQRIVRIITIYTKIFILYCTCNGLKKFVSNFSGFVR